MKSCIECDRNFKLASPFDEQVCFVCHKKSSHEETPTEARRNKLGPKVMKTRSGDHSRSQKNKKLSRGITLTKKKGIRTYTAYLGAYSISFSEGKRRSITQAKILAQKARLKMELLEDSALIEEYISKHRGVGKNRKTEDQNLPKGVGRKKADQKNSARYTASHLCHNKKRVTVCFSIDQLGEERALELALWARKKMASLNNYFSIKNFINTEVQEKKKEDKNGQGLPVGLCLLYRKGNPCSYSCNFKFNGVVKTVTFSVSRYGDEISRKLAIYTVQQKERLKTLSNFKLFLKNELDFLKKRKDLLDLECEDIEGYYEYNPETNNFEVEIYAESGLITFEHRDIETLEQTFYEKARDVGKE